MKESHVKGLANHNGPESCVEWSNPLGEALTGESVGWVLSRESNEDWDADPVEGRGRQQPTDRLGKGCWYPAWSETPDRHRNNLRENREILRLSQPARWEGIEKSKDVRR
jgi:hypothetical protein